jgi:hypothetical protein
VLYAWFATSLSGCFGGCWEGWEDDGWVDPGETFAPPTVDFDIPAWPPIGPTDTVTIDAYSEAGLESIDASFRSYPTAFLNGETSASIDFYGDELGEGLGTLDVTVTATDGGWTHRQVENLLVDLSPPTAYFDATVLPAAGATLDFWIADAWVVAGYDLLIGDQTFSGRLPEGYPATLGVEWDYSLVRIPVEELPLGATDGTLLVYDATGNSATFPITVTVDGVAPTSAFASPEEGATVAGTFDVTIDVADDLGGNVAVELYAGGALLTTAVGPHATVTLDASELPTGPLELGVVAIDAAGNRSAPALRTVVVESPE